MDFFRPTHPLNLENSRFFFLNPSLILNSPNTLAVVIVMPFWCEEELSAPSLVESKSYNMFHTFLQCNVGSVVQVKFKNLWSKKWGLGGKALLKIKKIGLLETFRACFFRSFTLVFLIRMHFGFVLAKIYFLIVGAFKAPPPLLEGF